MLNDCLKIIRQARRLLVLTGAGLSEASGIPTYRDHQGKWLASTPIQHQDFIASELSRQRYWARSAIGWPAFSRAQPNQSHYLLSELEKMHKVHHLITQNVDRLHQRAGHQSVTDLHGRLDRVRCLDCQQIIPRETVQSWLLSTNPQLESLHGKLLADGDACVDPVELETIQTPKCENCGGILMPDVVFFGGAVTKQTVQRTNQALDTADALLVVGSSLAVYSGYRFCKQAAEARKPVLSINLGQSRADPLFSYKIEADSHQTLAAIVKGLKG